MFLYLPKIYATLYVQGESRSGSATRGRVNMTLNTGMTSMYNGQGSSRGPSLSVVEPIEDGTVHVE